MKKKLFRVATVDIVFSNHIKGQLRFLSDYYKVVAVSNDNGGLKDVSINEGVDTIGISMKREISILSDIKSLWALIRLFWKERPYIVHSHTPKGSLLSMIAAWITGVPHRIYLVTGLRFETTSGLLRFILKTMERITCMCATKVIPEGEGVKKTLIREKITRKPLNKILNGNINGIDLNHFTKNEEVLSKATSLRSEKFTFIYIGRIVKDKGVNELVRAFDKLSAQRNDVRLLLLGTFEDNLDPIDTKSRQIIDSNVHIEYAGYQQDIRPYLASSDVLILPSYREGFPNVVIQAGAMDLPCIVTDINGCNEIIINGENGIIIPKQDENALYEAMLVYLDNREVYDRHSSKSRELVSSRYEQQKVWQALLDMYQSL